MYIVIVCTHVAIILAQVSEALRAEPVGRKATEWRPRTGRRSVGRGGTAHGSDRRPGDGRGKSLDAGSAGPVIVAVFTVGVCPAVNVVRLQMAEMLALFALHMLMRVRINNKPKLLHCTFLECKHINTTRCSTLWH